MGGCCCCSSRGTEMTNVPTYYYYPRSEEHVPLSSQRGPTLATGLLVDTNLDTSSPDTYRPPPVPIPYEVPCGPALMPPISQEISVDSKSGANPEESGRGNAQDPSPKSKDSKESDCKGQTDFELDDPKEVESDEPSKPVESIDLSSEEEDACPICLEEYDTENPKLCTKCEHHFHLACILEWMERSESCPVCDQELIFDPPLDS